MIINSYATLADFKNFISVRGQSTNMSTDVVDDAQISEILEGTSRYIDTLTHRTFYPRYETRYFSVPQNQGNLRTLYLDDDLLSVVSITNGDGIAVTEYNMLPKNHNPKWGIQIYSASSSFWTPSNTLGGEYVIAVEGWWGFHNQFTQRGWSALDTLAVAVTDTTSLTFTVTTGTTLLTNQIIKIDNEIMNVASSTSTPTKTVTVNQRGDNGSTAATHLINAPIYIWNPQLEIRDACKQISQSVYWARSGQVANGKITVTEGGVIIRAEDVSPMSHQTLMAFKRPL